jgi:succinate dehydrogenase / fumarate reductase membrane anchor subunit
MNLATKKWIFMKISSVILVPLMLWFIFNFVSIYNQNYLEVLNFFTNSNNKFLFSFFIVFAYFYSSLSISEVFEDYIQNEKIKNAANKALYIFAIIMPLITIIVIFNLKL